MPLSSDAVNLIRINLQELQKGNKVKLIVIGTLTQVQLEAINEERTKHNYSPITAEVVFLGRHTYKSRIEQDGYTIEDVIDQIVHAMDAASAIRHHGVMTGMQNQNPRADRYGNFVRDHAVFECMTRHPRPELFSVIPKGDRIKPKRPPV